MRFQFYFIDAGEQGVPVLTEVGDAWERVVNNTIGTLRQDAVAEGDVRFQKIVSSRETWEGQIVLVASIGHPFGSIVAVEDINPFQNQPRRLSWAWSDGSKQI